MRTLDYLNVKNDFNSAIDDIKVAFSSSEANTVSNNRTKELTVEYLFVATATFLESFISDLFIAYISKDMSKFKEYLISRTSLSSDDDYARRVKDKLSLSLRQLSKKEIQEVLDPSNYNVTFPTTDKMKEKSGQLLSRRYSTCFTDLSSTDCSIIDFTKTLRNYLAHRSKAAHDQVRSVITDNRNLPHAFQLSKNVPTQIGKYLRVKHESNRRFSLYIDYVERLADDLCL